MADINHELDLKSSELNKNKSTDVDKLLEDFKEVVNHINMCHKLKRNIYSIQILC